MTKEELIKCFDEDKASRKLKDQISKLVERLNKICDKKVNAGVEVSSYYVIDSEYHIFCGRTHIFIKKEKQDPWLSEYYIVSSYRTKIVAYNLKDMENDVKELLKKHIKGV